MNLSCLLSLIGQVPGYTELRTRLLKAGERDFSLTVPDAVKPYLIAGLYQDLSLPVLVIAAEAASAKALHVEMQTWCSPSAYLQYYPETDFFAGDDSAVDPVTATERLKTLSMLARMDDTRPPLIVGSALAVAGKTSPQTDFAAACRILTVGMYVDPFQLVREWQDTGYEMENLVEVPGTMGRRGGILDIFPPNAEQPIRIEFFGNRIDNMRFFNPETQRSLAMVTTVTIAPAKENAACRSATILDYLAGEALLITDEIEEIVPVIDEATGEAEESRDIQRGGEKPKTLPFLSSAELVARIRETRNRLTLCRWAAGDYGSGIGSLPATPVPGYGGRLDAFSRGLKEMLGEKRRVVVVSQQTNRLSELLEEQNILAHPVSQIEKPPVPGSVTLVQGSVREGWSLKDGFTLLTDKEIFGLVKRPRLIKKRPVRHHWFTSQLRPGDYVVHVEHGIARFIGLTRMAAEQGEREYLVLEYAAGDKLYVPADQVDRVSRYIGASDQMPGLSRLGTQEWARTKQRVRQSVIDVAQELLKLYAAREVVDGFAFSPDGLWQQELESSFPHVETPDQMEAVQAAKADMEKTKPMDRLICGDVGYGKTEVALRAAFKAVMDGKQVALLVPTTLLAQQHFATFCERLQTFPVEVKVLSRFCTDREQAKVIEGLAAGTVDICIGTHRLLQKDVRFKDLGLVIVDEEQRFGVVHKEHFKKLRQEVDVLTLSATPIPRTLHMAMAGIRDMSVIETPPEERLPIKTYVGAHDERLVREAVLREIERGGQVFYVHNRVQSIASVAGELAALVPEARISVAHGQMPEDELESVMTEFASHESDVLVTTTIVESGLDMPSVNTLIVDQVDMFGLSQLYQLRGRVGRGNDNAYAYFLFNRKKQLTEEAKKRLTTISEATELGAGFAIAMRDLEIRGAGNLLGAEQSGYIAVVGFDLYSRMLTEAVEELKQTGGELERTKAHPAELPPVALSLTAYIPGEYVPATSARILFYQRLVDARQADDIEDIRQELRDRFGDIPQPVQDLLFTVEIRQLAARAMVTSVLTENNHIVLQFSSSRDLSGFQVLKPHHDGVKVGNKQIRLDVKRFASRWREVLREVLNQAAAVNA